MTPEAPHVSTRTTRRYWTALTGYLALAAAFYAPVLLGLRWFPTGDFTDHFLPFNVFQRSELLAGRLPVWNPYTFSGHPFLADVQAAVFYPVSNLVLALTLPWGEVMERLYWLQVEAVLHVALGGFFTYLLARSLLCKRTPAFLAGCAFAFSGYLTGYPPLQTAILRTAIWLPLILWCLRRAFQDREGWRWWVATAFAYSAAFLGGHSQTFLLLSYCVVGWLVLLFVTVPGSKPAWLPRIALFFVLFLGLSAAQLWPSLEFAMLSVRANVDYAFVSGGLPLRDAWQFLAPGILSQFSPLYVGLIALGMAILALASALTSLARRHDAPARRGNWHVLYFACVALLALLASWGSNSFLYPVLYRLAPGWSLFRGQERSAYLLAFSLSLLAGYGLSAFLGLARRSRIVTALCWTALAAGALLAFTLIEGPSLDQAGQAALTRAAVVALAGLLGLNLLTVFQGNGQRQAQIVTALVLIELFAANMPLNLSDRPIMPSAEARAVAHAQAATEGAAGAPGRAYNESWLPEDYGMLVGVEDAGGSSPLRLERYDALLHDFPATRLWQLTGVQTVLSSQPDLYVGSQRLAEFSTGEEPGYLHRLAVNNPRAWVVNSIYTADDNAALPLLGDERLDLKNTVLLPPARGGVGRPLGLEDGLLAPSGPAGVRVERRSPTSLHLDVNSTNGGYLFVSENWLPGWKATVANGDLREAVPVLRTNLTFLGVQLPPGESTVELNYRPASVWGGLLVSGITLVLLAGAAAALPGATALPSALLLQRPHRVRSIRGGLDRLRAVRGSGMMPILLVAFGLRVFRLGGQELRGDEALGRLFSLQPVPEFIRQTLALREPHPVASYVIEGAWLRVAGSSEFALRFVSTWFGLLAVAIFYRLVRKLGLPQRTAMMAAGLLAISPYAIWHSQDARMYSISLALTLASTLLMLTALGQRRWLPWVGYVCVTWLTLQTHYYAAYIVIAQNLFVFIRGLASRDERRTLPRWILAQLATALLYLPWVAVAAQTLTGYGGNGDSPGFFALWLRSLSVFGAGETIPATLRAPLAITAGILAVVGALRLSLAGPVGRRALLLAALSLLVPLLTTWLGALSRPIFNERYIIAALPGFLLLVAASSGPSGSTHRATRQLDLAAPRAAWSGWAGAVLTALLASVMAFSLFLFYNDPAYGKSIGWRHLAAVMERHTRAWPATTVRAAESFPDPTLWYYYDAVIDKTVIPPAAQDQAGADAQVRELAQQGVERVVIAVAGSSSWDSSEIAQKALQGAYRLLLEVPVSGWRVQVYGKAPASLTPLNAEFTNGVRLAAAAVTPQAAVPGDVLPVYLRWEGDSRALAGDEKLTLQLLDAEGKLAAQADQTFGPADLAANPAPYAVPLPRLLAPGAYRLIAALYDPSKAGAPRVLTRDGADHVEIKLFAGPVTYGTR